MTIDLKGSATQVRGRLAAVLPKRLLQRRLPVKCLFVSIVAPVAITITGQDPHHDDEFCLMIEFASGGWSAFSNKDGASLSISNINGGFKDVPVEKCESKYPLRLSSYMICENFGAVVLANNFDVDRTRSMTGLAQSVEKIIEKNLSKNRSLKKVVKKYRKIISAHRLRQLIQALYP